MKSFRMKGEAEPSIKKMMTKLNISMSREGLLHRPLICISLKLFKKREMLAKETEEIRHPKEKSFKKLTTEHLYLLS